MVEKRMMVLLGLVISAVFLQHCAMGKPAVNAIDDNYIDERDVRRAPSFGGYASTYPPFPGDEDEFEYDTFTTQETGTEYQPNIGFETSRPPPYNPSDIPEKAKTPPPYLYPINSNNNEIEGRSEEPEPFHRKIVPWFKRQWGHTKNFFSKHYENAANQIG